MTRLQCSAQCKSSALKEIRNNPILRPFSSLVIFFPTSFWNHREQNSLKITSSLFTGGQALFKLRSPSKVFKKSFFFQHVYRHGGFFWQRGSVKTSPKKSRGAYKAAFPCTSRIHKCRAAKFSSIIVHTSKPNCTNSTTTPLMPRPSSV